MIPTDTGVRTDPEQTITDPAHSRSPEKTGINMGLWLYLLSYGAGLASAPYLAYSLVLPGLTLLCGLAYLVLAKSKFRLPLLLIFFWALGGSLYHLDLSPPTSPAHIRAFVGDERLNISGTVTSVAPRYGGGSRIDLKAHQVGSNKSVFRVHGRVRLYINQGLPRVQSGQKITFCSRLRAPRLYGIPGEFDFPRHLAYQNIFATAFLADSQDLAIFAPAQKTLSDSIEHLRASIGDHINGTVATPEAALVKALVIGDKSGLSPTQKELLSRGGVSHLFAISGLHLGLIGLLLYAVAQRFYRRSETLMLFAPPQRLIPLLLLPALLAYLLLTGNAISTRRAFIMTFAAGVLLTDSRQTPPLRLWATCAMLFLIFEPLIFYQPAFQLSFAGLFGILTCAPRWYRKLPQTNRWLRYVLTLGLTTTAATVATLPLVLMNFHLLAPAGLLTNLFAIPTIGLIAVPLGLTGAIFLPVWAPGAEILLQGCAVIVRFTLLAVDWIIHLPLLTGQLLYVTPVVLSGCFLLSAALLLPGNVKRLKWLRRLFILTALLLFLLPAGPATKLTVTALSVGQGDSTLLSFAGQRHFLIDGGGTRSKHFDVGERLVAPALGFLGVRSLEAVILTHDHPDHRKGLLYILQHFAVKEFWSPIPPQNLNLQLSETLAQRRIPIICVPPGWSRPTGTPQINLWLFAPGQTDQNLNNRSLVVLAGIGKDAAILTGDLEADGINQLLSSSLPQPTNLLKIPHHGSRNSSPEKLLDKLGPHRAFISLGNGNPHGFPHHAVVNALQRRHIPWWSTDRHGTLRFSSNGNGWQATHWNKRLFR